MSAVMSQQTGPSTAIIAIEAAVSLLATGLAGASCVMALGDIRYGAWGLVCLAGATFAIWLLIRDIRKMQDAEVAHLEADLDWWARESNRPPTRRKNVIPADVAELTAEIADLAREAGHLAARVIEASASLSARTSDMGEDFAEVLADRDRLRKRAALVDEIRKVADQAGPLADAPTPSAWPARPLDFADRRPPEEFAPPAEREAMRALQQAIGTAT